MSPDDAVPLDDASMAPLRAALKASPAGGDAVHRLDDHEVLALLGPGARGPALAAPTLRDYVLAPAAAPAVAAPASSGRPRPSAAPEAPAAPEEGSLRADLDAAAMVQVLQEAARNGSAFCEECAKAEAAA